MTVQLRNCDAGYTSMTRGNGVVTSYGSYTPLGAGAMTIDFPGTANDLTLSFVYNAAGQIKSRTGNSAEFWGQYI